jgi:hypothetical protein
MCPCVATSVKNSIKHIYRTINIIIIFILNDKYQLDGKLMGVCVEGEAGRGGGGGGGHKWGGGRAPVGWGARPGGARARPPHRRGARPGPLRLRWQGAHIPSIAELRPDEGGMVAPVVYSSFLIGSRDRYIFSLLPIIVRCPYVSTIFIQTFSKPLQLNQL